MAARKAAYAGLALRHASLSADKLVRRNRKVAFAWSWDAYARLHRHYATTLAEALRELRLLEIMERRASFCSFWRWAYRLRQEKKHEGGMMGGCRDS